MRLMYATIHAGGCSNQVLYNNKWMAKIFAQACKDSGAEVLEGASHRFSPQGYTEVKVIAESHAAIHTWPERGYAKTVFFTCSEKAPEQIDKYCSVWESFGFKIEGRQVIIDE